MDDTDGVFPDDVPVADAVEQQRTTGGPSSDDADDATARFDEDDVPLEASAADWQEQHETVLSDPELDEPEQ
jgi:hypothetical protein